MNGNGCKLDANNAKLVDIDIDIQEILDDNDLFDSTGGKEERLFWGWTDRLD